MSEKSSVAIIFGGRSTEHEVSVITGVQVLQNIDKEKYEALPIYVSKDGVWYTSPRFFDIATFKNLEEIPNFAEEVIPAFSSGKLSLRVKQKGILVKEKELPVDAFFPCFHGGLGEGGGFQGLFELAGIPYVGSGILGSALGMDKAAMKKVFESYQVPSSKYQVIYISEWEEDRAKLVSGVDKLFGYPKFVKPANGGSSIGVTKVNASDELENALELAFAFDRKVLVEEGITNAREINVSVMGNSGSDLLVSECEEVFHSQDFLSYVDKYVNKEGRSQGMASTKREIPAKIPADVKLRVQDLAKKVFVALDCFGLARVDFLYKEKNDEIFVIEINTIPGSMAFYLWGASGVPFKKLIDELIDLAMQRHVEKRKQTTIFASNILKDFKESAKGGKL